MLVPFPFVDILRHTKPCSRNPTYCGVGSGASHGTAVNDRCSVKEGGVGGIAVRDVMHGVCAGVGYDTLGWQEMPPRIDCESVGSHAPARFEAIIG